MPTSQTASVSLSENNKANGDRITLDIFALTDEQILEIEPQAEVASDEWRVASEKNQPEALRDSEQTRTPHAQRSDLDTRKAGSEGDPAAAEHGSQDTKHASQPPKWLADMMADPQAGAEARDLWSGVQQARQEASAFREVFAKPEEARAAAERARALDEIDAAFYGRAGNSPEEASAARAALAERLMREDPAGFREMVFAGLRALEEAGTKSAPRGQQEDSGQVSAKEPVGHASQDSSLRLPAAGRLGMAEGTEAAPQTVAHETQLAAYRTFESAANDELEKSVGGAIERALTQAIPNISRASAPGQAGAQSFVAQGKHVVPLQVRLQAAIREDIEAALKGDRQLGEQVAQVLASRRFDNATRAQVVRLINDRAQQLVPSAAKRVLNEWTQTTLAAHRAKSGTEKSAARADLAPTKAPVIPRGGPTGAAGPERRNPGSAARAATRLDYRKLSDEQILEL